ncbi:MAG: formylmethanofuran--tetrahydromethanopterin N-formyltransferase [Candidatus Hodarchaeota archaeon]
MSEIKIEGKGELYPLWISRILITAISPEWALTGARAASGFGTKKGVEAGVDIRPVNTIDNRPGVIIMICAPNKKLLEKEVARRIFQSLLTCPTVSVYDAMIEDPNVKRLEIGKVLSLYSDGFQKKGKFNEREVWSIPTMEGNMLLESTFGIIEGVSTNLIIIGKKDVVLKAGMDFAEEIQDTEGVICPFAGGMTKFGIKLDSLKYDFMKKKGTIDQRFCPDLRTKIKNSEMPPDSAAYQIVVDSIEVMTLFQALNRGIEEIKDMKGILKITAASFEGKLGSEQYDLKEIL